MSQEQQTRAPQSPKGAGMTPEQLDKARWAEACRRQDGNGYARKTQEYRELVVSNWTRPAPISPRLRAAREWLKGVALARSSAMRIDNGLDDNCDRARAFLAGVAWAVEKAKPLVELMLLAALHGSVPSAFPKAIQTYRQEIGEPHEGQ